MVSQRLVPMSTKELGRLQALQQVLDGRLTGTGAADILNLSLRHIRRLLARLKELGPSALAHALRGKPSKKRTAEAIRRKVIHLATTKYAGLNDTHMHEKITEAEKIQINQETLRLILRQNGIASPRKHRPPKHRQRRERMTQAGLMILTDGSTHDWLEGRGPRMSLLGIIDDATGSVLAATFREQEDTAGYLHIFRHMARTVGLPVSAYTDRHSIFVSYKKNWSLEEQLQGKTEPTQLGRALQELGIQLILSTSPQARGRVERLWGTFQDRLVSELRLADAKSLDDANRLLPVLLPDFNRRFTRLPNSSTPAWRKLPPGTNLDRIFCLKYPRVVANDNTVRIADRIFDIPPGPRGCSFARSVVDLCQLPTGAWKIYLNDRLIASFPTDAQPVRALRRTPLRGDILILQNG